MFKFRVLKPKETDWIESDKGISLEDSIQEYHAGGCRFHYAENSVGLFMEDSKEKHWFALFETADGGQLISRVITAGLYRRGGVKLPRRRTLADVARELGVAEDELAGPWEGESDKWT